MTKTDKDMPKVDAAEETEHTREIVDPDQMINQKLMTLYSAIENEEIPPRFLDLLEKLDEAERKAQAKNV